MDDFNLIIGSGGAGLVVAHNRDPIVAKYLYESKCADAEQEYKIHSEIYSAFEMAKRANPDAYTQLYIPKPLGYDKENVIKFGRLFSCYYVMTRLNNIDNQGLYHVVKDSMKSTVNRQIGKVYKDPISNTNPSRGFFATYSYLKTNILNLYISERGDFESEDDLIRYIGYAFGIIAFIAEYNPKDVEYALGMSKTTSKLCLDVLDFGMVFKFSFLPDAISEKIYRSKLTAIAKELEDGIDIDIYFPDNIEQIKILLAGIKDAVNLVAKSDKAYKEKWIVFTELESRLLDAF